MSVGALLLELRDGFGKVAGGDCSSYAPVGGRERVRERDFGDLVHRLGERPGRAGPERRPAGVGRRADEVRARIASRSRASRRHRPRSVPRSPSRCCRPVVRRIRRARRTSSELARPCAASFPVGTTRALESILGARTPANSETNRPNGSTAGLPVSRAAVCTCASRANHRDQAICSRLIVRQVRPVPGTEKPSRLEAQWFATSRAISSLRRDSPRFAQLRKGAPSDHDNAGYRRNCAGGPPRDPRADRTPRAHDRRARLGHARAVFTDRSTTTALLTGGEPMTLGRRVVDGWRQTLQNMDAVHHQITNHVISLDGDQVDLRGQHAGHTGARQRVGRSHVDCRRPPRLPAHSNPRRLADRRTHLHPPMGDRQRERPDPRDGRGTILTAHPPGLTLARSRRPEVGARP